MWLSLTWMKTKHYHLLPMMLHQTTNCQPWMSTLPLTKNRRLTKNSDHSNPLPHHYSSQMTPNPLQNYFLKRPSRRLRTTSSTRIA